MVENQISNFHNQFNVIAGYVQLEKYDDILDYIRKSAKENNKIYSFWQTKDPKAAALLYRKYINVKNKGISMEIEVDSKLEDIDSETLCTILNELLDNAIYELDNYNEKEKILTVNITEIKNSYSIAVGNSYPFCQKNIMRKYLSVDIRQSKEMEKVMDLVS